MRAAVLVGLAALAGCYDPTYRDSACGANGACPAGFTCVPATNVCVGDAELDAGPDGPDLDAPDDDAPDEIDAEVDAVPPCPVGELTSPTDPTRCFVFDPAPLTWSEARDACAASGAMLADVRDAQENVALIDLVGSEQSTWLGGTDAASEGAWIWPDGTPLSFNAWAEGQPSGALGEDCMRFVGPGTLGFGPSDWTDQPCDLHFPWICVHAP